MIAYPSLTPLRWVAEYKYLGQILDATASSAAAVGARIKCAERSLHSLDRLWALERLESRVKLWILDTIIMPSLTSNLATLCLTNEDMRKLKEFHYRALMCVHRSTVLTDPWGRTSKISYEELLLWTMAQDMETQMRVLRVNLAGRIARASANHPLRLLPTDEWDRLVETDLAALRAPIGILKDRHRCRKLLKRRNPYVNKLILRRHSLWQTALNTFR